VLILALKEKAVIPTLSAVTSVGKISKSVSLGLPKMIVFYHLKGSKRLYSSSSLPGKKSPVQFWQ
jgi:hypothetical protein